MPKPNISRELRTLPLEYIIAAPMKGAIKAQSMAAEHTIDFVNKVGFTEKNGKKRVNMIDFVYAQGNSMNMDNYGGGGSSRNEKKLSVPMLTMLPIPYIRLKDLKIHFDFKIDSIQEEKKISSGSGTFKAKYGFGGMGVSVKGSYNHSQENLDSTKRSTNMIIDVTAVQDQMPQGLQNILDIFNDMVTKQADNAKKTNVNEESKSSPSAQIPTQEEPPIE